MRKREMTPKERILASIRHQPTDQLPTDFWGVDEVTQKLYQRLEVHDRIGFSKALDLDCIMSVGPRLIAEDRSDMWGIEYKMIPLPGGVGAYAEPVRHPLAGFETVGEIEAGYCFPSTDMFDYSVIGAQCEQLNGYAIEGGYISLTYFYEMIRGTEQMLIDFIAEPDIAHFILHQLQEFSYAHTKRILEEGNGRIHLSQVTDDLGSQSGLLMSLKMIDGFLGEAYRHNIELVHSFSADVFHHNDGAMMEALPWLLEKGINILNPLQWHLPGWNLPTLKRDYGSRICFHGGIDNQYVLPFGTEDEVRAEVRACKEALYSDRTGYILAPCHNVQAITPIENILTMYDEAEK